MGIPEDTVAIINCAGENVLNPARRWNDSFKNDIHSSRIYTNKFLVDLIEEAEHKPNLFLSMSGVGKVFISFISHDQRYCELTSHDNIFPRNL